MAIVMPSGLLLYKAIAGRSRHSYKLYLSLSGLQSRGQRLERC
jgi:hypothetical protein